MTDTVTYPFEAISTGDALIPLLVAGLVASAANRCSSLTLTVAAAGFLPVAEHSVVTIIICKAGDALISYLIAACTAFARVSCAAALLCQLIADLDTIAEHSVIRTGNRRSFLTLAVVVADFLSVAEYSVVTFGI